MRFPLFVSAAISSLLLTVQAFPQSVIVPAVIPRDSSYSTAGGLMISVVSENKTPLDRQAVVKAYAKETDKVVWQTTGRSAEAVLGDLTPGIYDIEVSAVGFLTTNLEVRISEPNTLYQIHVPLTRDPSAIELTDSEQPMPEKARKEMSHGVAALKSGKLNQAEKHLEAADQLAPDNSDIKFLLGYLFYRQNDLKKSESYLTKACSLDPHHVQALTLLGRLQFQNKDYPAAHKSLEAAVNAGPHYWMAHNLLAEVALKEQNFDQAREQAQLAMNTGGTPANSALITLGQALEGLGRNHEALQAYKQFVVDSPSSPLAAQVRTMFDDLQQRMANPSTKSAAPKASSGPDVLLAASEPAIFSKSWGPPGIDDVKPSVAEGVTCPIEKVLNGAGERMQQLVDDLGRFNATEELLHEDLDELDHPITRTELKFNYVAFISEPQPGIFNVGEYRDRSGAEEFPDQIATRGLPALALIFHPDQRDNFQMTCEGLGDWRGKATWLVRFQQREDHPHHTLNYKIAGRVYAVSLKGRAWISADTFHIVHLESDLVAPMPEIQLLSEHLSVDYAPVQFQKKSIELWLPKDAELYFDFRHHHYLRRHSFDHFMLFSVDSSEKRNEPTASKEPVPSDKSLQNR
jgi:tetratricopeptide (TPR) repeat protein